MWFGSSNLAIQYWDIYFIYSEVWDGRELKISFRRGFDEHMMQRWYELVAIVEAVSLSEEPNQMIWRLHNSGIYNVQSLYVVVNFRGITPVFVQALWKVNITPRFLLVDLVTQ